MIDAFLGAPTADDWRTYTPVLRAKASEWKALKALTPGVRQRIAPILEFPDLIGESSLLPSYPPEAGYDRHARDVIGDEVGLMEVLSELDTATLANTLESLGIVHESAALAVRDGNAYHVADYRTALFSVFEKWCGE